MNQPKRRAGRPGPSVEPLEERALLAALSGGVVLPIVDVKAINSLDLKGSAQGKMQRLLGVPDSGQMFSLQGKGRLGPLGSVQLSGSMSGTGFIAEGRPQGTITLTNSKGSVTLSVLGNLQLGFEPPPGELYQFKIDPTQRTGAYADDVGAGTLEMHFSNQSQIFTVSFFGSRKTS